MARMVKAGYGRVARPTGDASTAGSHARAGVPWRLRRGLPTRAGKKDGVRGGPGDPCRLSQFAQPRAQLGHLHL